MLALVLGTSGLSRARLFTREESSVVAPAHVSMSMLAIRVGQHLLPGERAAGRRASCTAAESLHLQGTHFAALCARHIFAGMQAVGQVHEATTSRGSTRLHAMIGDSNQASGAQSRTGRRWRAPQLWALMHRHAAGGRCASQSWTACC